MRIGISGKKGSGKNTVADFLGLPQASFASPLKELVSGMFGITWDAPKDTKLGPITGQKPVWLEDELWQKCLAFSAPTYGEALQQVGTEIFRAHDADYWVKLAKTKDNVVFTDMRFPNEMAICDYTIRVERRNRPTDGRDESHPSETALDDADFDIIINNNGTLEELEKIVKGIFM